MIIYRYKGSQLHRVASQRLGKEKIITVALVWQGDYFFVPLLFTDTKMAIINQAFQATVSSFLPDVCKFDFHNKYPDTASLPGHSSQ